MFAKIFLRCVFYCWDFPGFSDSEMAVMNPDPSDLVDRLDLSMSSIDMTYTSLAMHEEKESEISGVGKSVWQLFISVQ